MRLEGNTILITGGTSGIGLAFAEEFFRLGNKVIICGRRQERLAGISDKYPGMIVKSCDLNDDTEREVLAEWVIKSHPDVNVLINNAGIQLATDLTRPVHMERIRSEIETNLIAPIDLTSLLVSHLSGKKGAAIINISSGLAFVPIAFMPVYCATKAAIHSLTLSLRHQLKDTNIKVFEIAPPSTDTELGHDRREDKRQTHGGIPVNEFLSEAMEALATDNLEAPIGEAKVLFEKREKMFGLMNS